MAELEEMVLARRPRDHWAASACQENRASDRDKQQGTVTLIPPLLPQVMHQVLRTVRKSLRKCWDFNIYCLPLDCS